MPARNDILDRFRRCFSGAVNAFTATGLLIGIACAVMAQSDDREGAQSTTLRPGVVIDHATGAVILMTDQRGLEAVEIASGNSLWTEQVSAEPLIVDDRLLLAQVDRGSEELELATFDVVQGGEPFRRLRTELPEGVEPRLDDRIGHRFRLKASMFEGQVFLKWTDTLGGFAAVPRKVTEPEIRSGVLRVDMRDGSIQPVDDGIGLQLFPDLPIGLSGEASIAGVEGTQFASAGGGYAVTSVRVADDRVWDKYKWTVWRRDGAEQVGTFRHFQPYAPFAVLPPVLILEIPSYAQQLDGKFEQRPLSIEAADLNTGETLWSRPIRDTNYDGPLPH